MITLGIGKMELDWGKNNVFNDHSCLFQKEDIKIVPYYYSDNEIEYKE
ncbi:HEPN/Toprim-associated domain-containing protein, partial [Streptococcus agalactiae]